MISSLLIANRGEIACRIIRTARRMGIRTVAVFSDADRDARHVEMADEAVRIGPAEARRSYLDAEAIVAAALGRGADAIHPGYGFLSEKPVLPELCARHGLVWVGASAEPIRRMGSKIEAKRIARDAGVAGVPGYDGESQDPARLLEAAAAIGFPVLIKASAGGGGKGMRRVDARADFLRALDLARREAAAAFGDDRVLLEKFVARPRHLEVQLAGDKRGGLIHLFERECSIQRNYQKLVEEAPAPRLAPELRERMLAAALRLGRAISYDSLGTVEFVLDTEGGAAPYFLEMNTRLQVEHPVTEMVTGLDLVALQIRIAAGEPVPPQASIGVRGAAIELRLNAEDAAAIPSLGRVAAIREPEGEGIRVDSGVRAGSEVTPYYDSLLLKLIGHGADRDAAIRRLTAALDRLAVLGVTTNRDLMRAILRHPDFRAGVLTTRFLADAFQNWRPALPDDRLFMLAAVLWLQAERAQQAEAAGPWRDLAGFRVLGRAGRPGRAGLEVAAAGETPRVVTVEAGRDGFCAEIDGRVTALAFAELEPGRARLRLDDLSLDILYVIDGPSVEIAADGRPTVRFAVRPIVEALAAAGGEAGVAAGDVVAPMPGVISAVEVQIGQAVRRDHPVVVMEAMKLVLSLTAPTDGVVRAIHCAPGQTVPGGARLVEIAPPEDAAEP